jgi:hypothetical protein
VSPSRESAPSNLTGANKFAVGGRSLGRRGFCAVHATNGSTLDGALSRRNNRRHRWTGHPHRSADRGAEDRRNGDQPHTQGSGASRPASAAAPVSAPAREGAAQPTPRARTDPRHSPLRTRWSRSHFLTHPSSALRVSSSRSLCAGSARAWREPQASALEAVEKVVTGF